MAFSDSAVFDYAEAFYVGFNFDRFYRGSECFENFSWSLDSLYDFRLEMLRRLDYSEPLLYMMVQTSTVINEFWYNCYQFKVDFMADYFERKA